MNSLTIMHNGHDQFALIMDTGFLRRMALSIAEELRTVSQCREIARRFCDHDVTNNMVVKATFLYRLVESELDNPHRNGWFALLGERTDEIQANRENIATALSAFQSYKTAICKAEQEEMGPAWGTATGFYQTDWADLNEKFLAVL